MVEIDYTVADSDSVYVRSEVIVKSEKPSEAEIMDGIYQIIQQEGEGYSEFVSAIESAAEIIHLEEEVYIRIPRTPRVARIAFKADNGQLSVTLTK